MELTKLTEQNDVVAQDGALIFDTVISSWGTRISYDMAGTITFNESGFYYIDWYIAPQHGLTTNGSNWAIQTGDGRLSLIGSSHTKVSATTGFAIINAAANDTVRLVNVSDGVLHLSRAVDAKAGLIVYGIMLQGATQEE